MSPPSSNHILMRLNLQFLATALAILSGAGRLVAQPSISSFSPAYGASSDPGYITISGSGFSPGSLIVQFNGVTDFTAGAVAANLIQAHVPPGAPLGAGPIYVSVNGQSTWSAQDFTVIGPGPYIAGFGPSSGNAGASVTFTGAHFASPLTVKFSGASPFTASPPSSTSFTVAVPTGVTTGPVTMSNYLGSFATATNFFVPSGITNLSPTVGRTGTNVLITGTNFIGTTAVRFNGVDAISFTILSNNAIQVVVPTNATTGPIRVITPASSALSPSNFVVRPTITGFSPNFGNVGTNVLVSGENLFGTTDVKFNGTNAAFSGVSYGQLTATVPAGATTGPISVTTTNGGFTNVNNFYLPPKITSFTPNNSGPGTTVKITGVNFTDASSVSFNGKPAGFTVTNNTTIGAIVPNGVLTGPISVTTPAGSTNSSGLFYGLPGITGFSPSHGLPGTNVIISGTNFLGATSIKFGTNTASFTVLNNTTIGTTVPNGASTGPITVIAPGGTSTTGTNFLLDYTADLSVQVLDSPDPVMVGSNLVYTITVLNNGPYAAPGVVITNTLPGSALLVAATTSQGTLNTNGNPVVGNLGSLGLSGNVIVTLKIKPQVAGGVVNAASVASDYADPSPGNNTAITTTLVQSLPLLSIRLTDTNRVRVSWPAELTNYSLQYALAMTNYWSNDLTAPQTAGGERFVSETNLGTMKYYRLTK